ncbi:MAG: hypothetical protein FWG66_05415 [Spirochaetes bacterium]|nr:hypothetical protein [Spirochaetota bacterium]
MNNLEKEYIYFKSKTAGNEFIANEIRAIQEGGGIVSFKDDVTDLIYTCADGDECHVDVYPRLYWSLVLHGEIEEVELTEEEVKAEKTAEFSVRRILYKEAFSRVREYVEKARRDIAEGLITVETPETLASQPAGR